MPAAIELHHASVHFGNTKALQDVTLNLAAGKIIGVLGPSGAGKTTLMRAIVGRRMLDHGKVLVLGKPAGHRSLRGRVGYMTQALSIYPDLSVVENLRYFATLLGVARNRVDEYIAEVDLTDQAKQMAGTLSGGQKSRLSLAIALLGDPELLVLDEPTVGVDPVLRQQLWSIFRHKAEQGVTTLVSSHVMDEASRCDDLVLVRRGKILAHDTPAALCARTQTMSVEDAFLKLVEGEK